MLGRAVVIAKAIRINCRSAAVSDMHRLRPLPFGFERLQSILITDIALRDVRSILEAHYLNHDPKLGGQAICKLESVTEVAK